MSQFHVCFHTVLQKLKDFHSLSCPGFTADDCPAHTFTSAVASEPPQNAIIHQSDGGWTGGGRTSGMERECLWAELYSVKGRDAFQLGGELDIEQIERN